MTSLLLDTHVWAWTLDDRPRLSVALRSQIASADTVLLSPISLFEIGWKTRLGKWPAMEPILPDLMSIAIRQGLVEAPIDSEIALTAATLEWPHRDPFDRFLAATAIVLGVPLVTADTAFLTLSQVERRFRQMWL